MATSKKGSPALYAKEQLGFGSYRTAWMMGQKIRRAMMTRDSQYRLKGIVEADEIFIGGKISREKRKFLGLKQTPFFMAIEEDAKGRPRFMVLHELKKREEDGGLSISSVVYSKIELGSEIRADGKKSYEVMRKLGDYRVRQTVYRKNAELTQKRLRWVNTVTSNLKRYLLSTHHGVFPKYRKIYLAEFAYRFNRRFWPGQAFDRLLYACIHSKPTPLPELSA